MRASPNLIHLARSRVILSFFASSRTISITLNWVQIGMKERNYGIKTPKKRFLTRDLARYGDLEWTSSGGPPLFSRCLPLLPSFHLFWRFWPLTVKNQPKLLELLWEKHVPFLFLPRSQVSLSFLSIGMLARGVPGPKTTSTWTTFKVYLM